jgi:hypothetical protein
MKGGGKKIRHITTRFGGRFSLPTQIFKYKSMD